MANFDLKQNIIGMRKFKLVFLLLVLTLSVSARGNNVISVEGKSKIKATPEVVSFQVQLTSKDESYTQCSDALMDQINQLKTLFTKNDVDTLLIKTMSFMVHERMEYDQLQRKQISIGYEAMAEVHIKQELNNTKTGIIFELLKNHFQANLNIGFQLSDKQIDEIKDQLIHLAVKDAQSKAMSLASGLEVKLGKINQVQYGEPQLIHNFNQPNYDLESRAVFSSAKGSSGFETLTPADVEMKTNVVVSWKIKQ